MKYDVIVIIFNYLYDNKLDRCIESVKKQTYTGSVDIKIIDSINMGRYRLNSKLFWNLSCDKVFFCDSMSVLSPNCIEDMKNAMDLKKTGASAAYILHYDGLDYINGGYYEKTAIGKMYNLSLLKKILYKKNKDIFINEISRHFVDRFDMYEYAHSATVYENRNVIVNREQKQHIESLLINELSGENLKALIREKCDEGRLGFSSIPMFAFSMLKHKIKR